MSPPSSSSPSSSSRSRSSSSSSSLSSSPSSLPPPPSSAAFEMLHSQTKHKAERIKQVFGYTNESNPFGDVNLSKPFIWKKKIDRIGNEMHISKDEMIEKQENLIKQIEKVKQRRAEREIEKLKLDDQRNEITVEKEQEIYEQWVEKERDFHKEQAKIRPEKRIEQGRLKPVDFFVKIVIMFREQKSYDNSIDFQFKFPFKFLKSLNAETLEEYLTEAEIQKTVYTDYEDYWTSLIKMGIEAKTQIKSGEVDLKTRSIVAEEYLPEIKSLLKGKNKKDLEELEGEIRNALEERNFTMDVEFYENILKKIDYYKAKKIFGEYKAKYLKNLEMEAQLTRESKLKIYEENIVVGPHSPYLLKTTKALEKVAITEEENEYNNKVELNEIFENEMKKAIDLLKKQLKDGGKSLNFQGSRIHDDNSKLQEGSDRQKKEEDDNDKIIAEQIMNFEKTKPLKPNEERFDDMVEIKKIYEWTEKYKPRKPRYFNRVKTGYEWNKYNQTHYDFENPPPKVIQGYKFNIFYPDLIDKSKTPEYTLEMADNPQFCIIKFKAGPPYEDIAFKIVNKEWDFADKKGFKSVFSRGILHLYFNFKRYRYRR